MTNFAQAFGNKFNQNAIRTRTFELNGHTFKVKVPLTHETEEMYEKVKQVDEEKAQKYYEKMSELLKDIIAERKDEVIEYEQYLKKIADLCNKVTKPSTSDYPESINTRTRQVMYDNLGNDEKLAIAVDEAIISNKADDWRGNKIKEKTIQLAIKKVLRKFGIEDEQKARIIFDIAVQAKNGY